MTVVADDALATLWLPFTEQHLHWPTGPALFLRARAPVPTFARNVICTQSFKPDAEVLQRIGLNCTPAVEDDDKAHYAVTLMLPPRQRDEARALLAQAVALTQTGGHVVLSASNNEGARSIEQDLQKLTGDVHTLSKHKCRVCWNRIDPARIDAELLNAWRTLDVPRPIADARFVSRPGIFAWDRIDPASALLARHLPTDLKGHAADLGAGFGYLSVELLSRCPGITQLDLYEAEARALDLARQNLQSYAGRVALNYRWHDVTQGLLDQYDHIVSNPPFHTQSRADRPDIGQRFIVAAAASLKPGGSMWLVANRHLPYEDILNKSFGQTRIVTEQNGFKIIHAVKAASAPINRKPHRTRR